MRAEEDNPEPGRRLALRTVVFGGVALDLAHLLSWYRRYSDSRRLLVNMYGITETTVHVSYQALSEELAHENPGSLIGRNIPDLRVYVLDDYLHPVPVGVAGEMYVAGSGLARGYMNHPAPTPPRVFADPGGRPGPAMYCSGDLARRRKDGTLQYLGRADQQVKIRGLRIEPGEIESALRKQPGVAQAAVIVRDDGPAGRQLVAYVAHAANLAPQEQPLPPALRESLPEHIIPAAFVMMTELPVTTNGKPDRRALPAPGPNIEGVPAAPTPTEAALSLIFCQVLRLEQVGPGDNFFHLGGDSIVTIQVVSLARR